MRVFLTKILGFLIIILFLQMPFFIMQYMSHLEGHLAELTLYREELLQLAKKNHLALPDYVAHFHTNPDRIFSSQGAFMQNYLERYEYFKEAWIAFQGARPWGRPMVFLRYIDRKVFAETTASFQFGLSLSLESLCYFAVGSLCSLFIYNILRVRSKNGNV
ncbi:MAG: DUF2937 family protein [Chlamydiae bacterium]|nr:DUF2937 family protein [Chlamydiota bacterium]